MSLLARTALALASVLLGGALQPSVAAPAKERLSLVERVEWEITDKGARVIVVVRGVVQYTTHGASPDAAAGLPSRAYVDLTPAQLGRDIDRSPIAVDDRLVRRIRIGQFDRRTARVVIDLTEPAVISVKTAERPSRLVLNLMPSGAPVSAAPAPPERVAEASPPKVEKVPIAAPIPEPPPASAPAPASASAPASAAASAKRTAREAPSPPEPPPPEIVAEVAPEPLPSEPPASTASPHPTATPRALRSVAPRAAASPHRFTVVLDPGHGGDDPGARGVTGDLEKSVTLSIAELVAERLAEDPDIKVFLTRSEDTTLPLAQRTAAANAQGADLFLSIHANASESPMAVGIESYTLNNTDDRATIRLAALENGLTLTGMAPGEPDLAYILSDLVQTGKEDESVALAEAVQGELVRYLRDRWKKVHDLGVKRGPFYVLVGAYMPCVLTEVGFLTNETEGQRIATLRYQQDIAEGMARGIRAFLGSESASTNL